MSNPGIPFDPLLLGYCDLSCFEIFDIADQCNEKSKSEFPPYTEVSYYRLLLNVIELTSINSTDDNKTIEMLVDMAQMYSNNILRPIIEKLSYIESFNLYDYLCANKLTPCNVCVSCLHVKAAKDRIIVNEVIDTNNENTVNIVSVTGGFPMGKVPISSQIAEVEYAISQGAKEIDIVIDRGLAIDGDFSSLYKNVNIIKGICVQKGVKLKTILSVTELESFTIVYKTALTVMMAGSDFISTSTGKEIEDAPLCYGVVMCRAIQNYYNITNYQVGFKANGGIVQSEQTLGWLMVVASLLGHEWLNITHFRIGATSVLLKNIIEKLCAILLKSE